MDITIGVTVSDDLKDTAVAKCEELILRTVLADNPAVMSAVILREDPQSGSVGWSRMKADENTRQSR